MKTQYTFNRQAIQDLITAKVRSKLAAEETLDFKWEGQEVIATVKQIPIVPAGYNNR